MVRKKSINLDSECLNFKNDSEDGLIEGDFVGDQGTIMSSFKFTSSPETAAAPASAASFNFNQEVPAADILTDNRKIKTEASIATPEVDDEGYTIGRYYKLRYSTAKMLNEIKASHPDVNVYMNTIVDEAIRFYYSAINPSVP
jgi:hypothetical protein